MTTSKYQNPETSKWLKEQNAVATKFGYINSETGEQLTSDTTLEPEYDVEKPNSVQHIKDAMNSSSESGDTENDDTESGGTESNTETSTITDEDISVTNFVETLNAVLNVENNDMGHEFSLAQLSVNKEFNSIPISLEDNIGTEWKINLVKEQIESSDGEIIRAVLKRYRKDQTTDINTTVTIKLHVNDNLSFDIPIQLNITSS